MPSKTKNTPTKESDEAAAAAAEIAALKAQIQRRDQELAALESALRPTSDGIISTPAPVVESNNPWTVSGRTNLLQPPSVAPQIAPTPARALDLEEKADTLRHVTAALEQKAKAKDCIISPKYPGGMSDALKLMRRVTSNDTDFDHAAFVQTLL